MNGPGFSRAQWKPGSVRAAGDALHHPLTGAPEVLALSSAHSLSSHDYSHCSTRCGIYRDAPSRVIIQLTVPGMSELTLPALKLTAILWVETSVEHPARGCLRVIFLIITNALAEGF